MQNCKIDISINCYFLQHGYLTFIDASSYDDRCPSEHRKYVLVDIPIYLTSH